MRHCAVLLQEALLVSGGPRAERPSPLFTPNNSTSDTSQALETSAGVEARPKGGPDTEKPGTKRPTGSLNLATD